jgi:hypothetical protein
MFLLLVCCVALPWLVADQLSRRAGRRAGRPVGRRGRRAAARRPGTPVVEEPGTPVALPNCVIEDGDRWLFRPVDEPFWRAAHPCIPARRRRRARSASRRRAVRPAGCRPRTGR